MEAEIYVLGLQNFKDDSVVFGTDELDSIKKEITKHLKNKGLSEGEYEAPGGWQVYRINPRKFYAEMYSSLEEPYIKKPSNFEIYSIELGYYHHRVIVYFKLGLKVDSYISKENEIRLKKFIYGIARGEIQEGWEESMNYVIDECMEKMIAEFNSYGKEEEIMFYVRMRVRNELKKMIDNIIHEYMKEGINCLKYELESGLEELERINELESGLEELERINELESGLEELERINELESGLEELDRLKSDLEKLVDNIVGEQEKILDEKKNKLNELIESKIGGLKEMDELKSELEKSVDNIIGEQKRKLGEKKSKLKNTEELKSELEELTKSKERIMKPIYDTVDKYKQVKVDEINFSVEYKTEVEVPCIKEKLKNELEKLRKDLRNLENLENELKYLENLKCELKRLLDNMIDAPREIRYSSLEKVRKWGKRFVDIMIRKYMKETTYELKSFEEIGIIDKILLYFQEKIRRILRKFLDYTINFLKIIFDIYRAISQFLDKIDIYLEIKLRKLLFKEVMKEEDRFLVLRDARRELGEGARNLINNCVKKRVNELVTQGNVREEGKIEFTYTYPLIVVESSGKKHEPVPFSEETTSLCFEIIEPKWWKPLGRKHLMRISIPSTILYVQKKVGKDLLRDVINSIYQHCLYEKKGKDEMKLEEEIDALKKTLEIEKKRVENTLTGWEKVIELKYIEMIFEDEKEKMKERIFTNRLDEDILTRLWTHTLDTMGGESAEVHAARMESITRFLAIVAIVISLIAILYEYSVITKLSELLSELFEKILNILKGLLRFP